MVYCSMDNCRLIRRYAGPYAPENLSEKCNLFRYLLIRLLTLTFLHVQQQICIEHVYIPLVESLFGTFSYMSYTDVRSSYACSACARPTTID